MKKRNPEDVLEDTLRFLSRFFPERAYLYFPLISAVLAWALGRNRAWRERILSWKVWPGTSPLAVKPDAFILDFFTGNPRLSRAFAVEVEAKDMDTLRAAFDRLYPLLGLEDPFLRGLFSAELASGDYRKIIREFDPRVKKAVEDIESVRDGKEFGEVLERFARELASLGMEMVGENDVEKALARLMKKNKGARGA